jgi:hypothetical protein
MGGFVTAVSRSATHTFSKSNQVSIRLLIGLGVDGDAHMGETVKHCSRVARDRTQPNLRQVHLIHAELLDELRAAGFAVSAGQIGENITTVGVDLLGLPTGARLQLGKTAVVEVTGLRNPATAECRLSGETGRYVAMSGYGRGLSEPGAPDHSRGGRRLRRRWRRTARQQDPARGRGR